MLAIDIAGIAIAGIAVAGVLISFAVLNRSTGTTPDTYDSILAPAVVTGLTPDERTEHEAPEQATPEDYRLGSFDHIHVGHEDDDLTNAQPGDWTTATATEDEPQPVANQQTADDGPQKLRTDSGTEYTFHDEAVDGGRRRTVRRNPRRKGARRTRRSRISPGSRRAPRRCRNPHPFARSSRS